MKRRKKAKVENNYFKEWKPKDWSNHMCQRPISVDPNIFDDLYLSLIREFTGFPQSSQYEFERKAKLDVDTIRLIRDLLQTEIIESKVSNIHNFLIFISQGIGRCDIREFDSKICQSSAKLLSVINEVNSIEKIKSITVAVQTEKNEERRITLDESASELFEKIQDTILSVRSSNKFSRFYSSIRFFYGPELKKY